MTLLKTRLGRVVNSKLFDIVQYCHWLNITFSYTFHIFSHCSKVFYSYWIVYFWYRAHTCDLPTIWKNFLVNRGVYYVDNWWCNLVQHRFNKVPRNIVVAAGTIVSKVQNNLLGSIVASICIGILDPVQQL